MDNASGHTMNLANSIIGVSILAMPYCFKQCGILLSVLILLISSIMSRLACHFLLKSAIKARRKTFEFLAFHVFGSLGKFSIEIGMIGFQLGACVAFFVVMGDLGPAIVSEMTGAVVGSALRNSVLIALAVFCVLPLGLLRNVDSLNGVSKATVGFYCCLVLKIVLEALPHIFTGDWVSEVVIWRPAGILQCLPIFSMALSCQTQLFEIYQAIPNASLEKMNSLIKIAVNICTWVYIFVGAFGYIAFFQKPFTGNVLLSFKPTITSDVIKMGFVLSLAFSFPLVIFPCRASLYSLLYKGPYTSLHEGAPTNYIPEVKFKMLTLVIVTVSLVIGIIIPNIELVLGLVGSTIGVMICVIFPVTCFICISPKNTNERILAQIMLFVGIIVMVLGTYANLYAFEEAKLSIVTEKNPPQPEIMKPQVIQPEKPVVIDIPTTIKVVASEEKKKKPPDEVKIEAPLEEKKVEVRHEPPQPEERVKVEEVRHEPPQPEERVKVEEVRREPPQPEEPVETPKPVEEKKIEEKQGPVVEPVQPPEEPKEDKVAKKNEEVDNEAIKKEETELKEEEDKKVKDSNQILIDTIQKQNEVQKEMVEQQKKLIEVIQKHQEIVQNKDIDKVNEEKVKAVKQIESIARKAIESISGKDAKLGLPKKEEQEEGQKRVEEIPKKNTEDKLVDKVEKIEEKEKIVEEINLVKNESGNIKMVPLPIALAKANNVTLENKIPEQKDTPKDKESEIKNMRRDILSENDENKARVKRDVAEEKIDKLNKAMKEVCNEMNKLTSTEKPLIKMLCKLSEPELVQADLGLDQNGKFHDVKPQKRDLKQFSEK
ncbi:putative sodium-coupled neutral amino acid transporter 10 [Tribolium madens]|uniref:putative sodium-coupled neutral amino acid transporter 10 n=1 Tax=Tribolium madens TaxID=41895 RepID=UPI001CF739DE|nr:putative sodium-coupled neutral amino acid transporter 10 [Tribolium madens]